MKKKNGSILLLLGLASAGIGWLLSHGLTASNAGEPTAPTVDAALVARGEYLAHAADCVACHSAPSGAAYAGGRGMHFSLGTIYSTNITPDVATGIGGYTEADFDHALRLGIAKDGHHLYPAMPYPSYAKIADADVAALYAYFMRAVKPVNQPNRATGISWPLNMRWPLALWNWAFLDTKRYQNDSGHDVQWNRGAYLVQGLGHCGACHTPRGWLFQEKALSQASSAYLSGARLDNWSAVDLTGDAGFGLGRWSEADLVQFFKSGHGGGATAFGSMIDAINYSTQYLSDEDNAAMAHYLKSLAPAHPDSAPRNWTYDASTADALSASRTTAPGAALYQHYCEGCHRIDGKASAPYIPALAGNAAVLDRDPISLINITLNGSAPVVVGNVPDAYRMVSFRELLNDQQIAEVITFMRTSWGNAASEVSTKDVEKLREQTGPAHYNEVDLLRMR